MHNNKESFSFFHMNKNNWERNLRASEISPNERVENEQALLSFDKDRVLCATVLEARYKLQTVQIKATHTEGLGGRPVGS